MAGMRDLSLELVCDRADVRRITGLVEVPPSDEPYESTVGELAQRMVLKSHHESSACLMRIAFRMIRRALVDMNIGSASDIRPRTRIEDAIPKCVRRQVWLDIENTTRLVLPDLRRPYWMFVLFLLLVPILTVGSVGLLLAIPALVFICLPVSALFWAFVLITGTRTWATHLPRGCTTFRDLADFAADASIFLLVGGYRGDTIEKNTQATLKDPVGRELIRRLAAALGEFHSRDLTDDAVDYDILIL